MVPGPTCKYPLSKASQLFRPMPVLWRPVMISINAFNNASNNSACSCSQPASRHPPSHKTLHHSSARRSPAVACTRLAADQKVPVPLPLSSYQARKHLLSQLYRAASLQAVTTRQQQPDTARRDIAASTAAQCRDIIDFWPDHAALVQACSL